nr:MAG: protease [Otus scops adenovirus]
MSGTTETELRHLVAAMHLQHRFLGVYDNSFPGFLNPAQSASAIVNTGSRASGGMHWIAFAFDPVTKRCYMFDPFGWSDSKLWELYKVKYDALMRRTGLKQADRCFQLVRSTETVQCPCSAACGLFSALFIASFDKYRNSPMNHNPIIDVVDGVPHSEMFDAEGRAMLHANQDRLYSWFANTNRYFRANEKRLRAETAINSLPGNHVE